MSFQSHLGRTFVAYERNLTTVLDHLTRNRPELRDDPRIVGKATKLAQQQTRKDVGDQEWSAFLNRQRSSHPLTSESRSVRKVRGGAA